MKPCENRWIELSVNTRPSLNAKPISYLFEERVNEMKINGFGIDIKSGKIAEIGTENLGEHTFVYQRLVKEFGISDAKGQVEIAMGLLNSGVSESDYTSFLKKNGVQFIKIMKNFITIEGSDPFGVVTSGNDLLSKINTSNWNQAAMEHGNFARKFNAYLSYLDKSEGNVADIIQTIRWFKDVIKRSETFDHSTMADNSAKQADKFIALYSKRELLNKDYPSFVEKNLPLWIELINKHMPNQNFDPFFAKMRLNLNDPKRLQKSHCEFVMELSSKVVF